jgi:quercetin dioxygenase-like cupin family protein
MKTACLLVAALSLAANSTEALAKAPRCRAAVVDLARLGDDIVVNRVYTGADGKSHLDKTTWAAVKTTYLGLQLAHFELGDPSNVVIVRGPPNFDIPFHAAPYREIFIVLSGSSTSILSDGTRIELTPGSILLFEDVTGPGHGGKIGPCGYVALDLQFKPVASPPAR